MVLQNKYKARASKRYNAARGGISDNRGRGSGRGRGSARRYDETSFPSLPGQEGNEQDENDREEGEEEEEDESIRQERAKYAPRKLTSNSWRFEHASEEENEAEGEKSKEENEPEPEIDLSGLLERVAKLDSNRTTKAISNSKVENKELNDIDSSLLHLIEKQKFREKGISAIELLEKIPKHSLSIEQQIQLENEGKKLQIEKLNREKHEKRANLINNSNKIISLNIGSSRREKIHENDNDKKNKKNLSIKNSNTIGAANKFLNDDYENEDLNNKDDIDSFLSEIDNKNQLNSTFIKNTKDNDSIEQKNLINKNYKAKEEIQSKVEQDFLDELL